MILVTGGTGLVGAHLLLDLLKKGSKVRALRRRESRIEEVKKIFSYYSADAAELFSKIEWVEGDLLDTGSLQDAMEGITHVYHCAAQVSMDPKDRESLVRNNVSGTANMVNAALEKKVKKFCHVGSMAGLGISTNGKEITEETSWNGKTGFSGYAVSKFLSENEVWRASQEGLNTVIVNPTVVIGPGNWRRSSGDIFLGAAKGYRWYSSGSIGFVDVRDVTSSMIRLMESEITNERFILVSENLPYKRLMDIVYTSIHKPLPNKKAGRIALALAWRADKLISDLTGNRHVVTREVARYASMDLLYSNAKIRSRLGMNFISVEQSIRDTAAAFISDFPTHRNNTILQ